MDLEYSFTVISFTKMALKSYLDYERNHVRFLLQHITWRLHLLQQAFCDTLQYLTLYNYIKNCDSQVQLLKKKRTKLVCGIWSSSDQ